jgi:hypothetical protein
VDCLAERDHRRSAIRFPSRPFVVGVGGWVVLARVTVAVLVVADMEVVVEEVQIVVDVEVEVIEPGYRDIADDECRQGDQHQRPRSPRRVSAKGPHATLEPILADPSPPRDPAASGPRGLKIQS